MLTPLEAKQLRAALKPYLLPMRLRDHGPIENLLELFTEERPQGSRCCLESVPPEKIDLLEIALMSCGLKMERKE